MAALLLVAAGSLHAWRSPLYPAGWGPPEGVVFNQDYFLQDFSHAGYAHGEAPLPWIQGPVFNVLDYGADAGGTADSTLAIQAAINACGAAGGGVVWLPEGLYRVAPPAGMAEALLIDKPGVVLRGAGETRTFLLNTATYMRSRAVIRVANGSGSWLNATSPRVPLTQDLTGPTNRIPVADVDGFAIGEHIVVHAQATPAWITEHQMDTVEYWLDKGASLGGVAFYRKISWIERATSTLVLDTPIRYSLKLRDNAAVFRTKAQLTQVGIEHLAIGNVEHPGTSGWGENDYTNPANSSYDVHDSWLVIFSNVRDGWIRGIHSFQPAGNALGTHMLSNGILALDCRNVTIRDCDLQKVQYGGGGGNGYTYRLQNSQELLLADCAARYQRHGFVQSHMRNSGNVLHRTLTQLCGRQTAGTGTTSGKGSDHHMHFSQAMLFDMADADRDFYDALFRGTWGTVAHGLTATQSVFWNTRGIAAYPGVNYVVRSDQYGYGYVIGTSGANSAVSLSVSSFRTAPADYLEGQGSGATLEPASLFADQLQRRTGIVLAAPQVAPAPEMPLVLAGTQIDALLSAQVDWGMAVPSGRLVQWWQLEGPSAMVFQPAEADTLVRLPEPGVYRFRCRVDNGWYSASADVELVVAGGSAYLAWAQAQFGTAAVADPGLEATLWGSLADPDRDGTRNRFEFVHGTDPKLSTPQQFTINAQDQISFHVSHAASCPRVEFSTNGASWSTIEPDRFHVAGVSVSGYDVAVILPAPAPVVLARLVSGE